MVGLGGLGTALAVTPRTRGYAVALGTAAAVAGVPSVAARLRRRANAPQGADDLIVLAANVLVGRADTGALGTLLERERPDLVALAEAGGDYRDKLMPLVAGLGYRAWSSVPSGVSDGAGVVLLAAERMGDLEVASGPEMRGRYLRATGGILGRRSFLAVHPEAPIGRRRTAAWRADLAHVARWCAEAPTPIVAGDFNATSDHTLFRATLGACRNAADGTGRALAGTFPASLPRVLGIQIDHVLVPRMVRTVDFRLVELPGSDHRGVLTRVTLPTA